MSASGKGSRHRCLAGINALLLTNALDHKGSPSRGRGRGGGCTHRGVLALDAGAVEAQGSDTGGAARDVENALVVALSRLRLGQVLGRQGDGLHHTHRDVYLGGGQDLWAVLWDRG